MKDKVNRFNTTNIIARHDLFRISENIVNHFKTINTLEIAKYDLLPLIGERITIAKGRESEKYALELSKSVIDLFKALLEGDISDSKEYLELIKNSQIPDEIRDALDNDVDNYIEKVAELKKVLPQVNQKKRSEE